MQKTILLLVLGSLFLQIAFTAELTCKDHPAYLKAKDMIKDIIKGDVKGAEKGQKLLKVFEDSEGKSQSAEDLGVCAQYADQKSCCNKNLIKLIDKAALMKIKPLQQKKNAFHKFVVVYNNKLNKDKCQSQIPASIDAIMKDDSLVKFKEVRNSQKQCKVDFGKAISALTRGAMCSICAGTDKVSQYFDSNGKLIISAESQKLFEDAATKAIDCISTSVNADNLGKIIDELNEKYGSSNAECKKAVKDAVLLVFASPNVTNDDGKSGKKCNGKNIFSVKPQCENSIGGDSKLDTDAVLRLLRSENDEINRILETAGEDAIIGANGIKIFVPSQLDSQVDENGAFNIDLEDVDTNSSINLAFGALIGLLILLL